MLTISSEKELAEYKRQRALVTLFLDSGYRANKMKVVMEAKEGFDAHVGQHWHMLIPYKDGSYAADSLLDAKNYGITLSRQIIVSQGIAAADLPVLMFENYTDEGDHFHVSLAGLSEDEIVSVIGTIGDIVVDHAQNGRMDPADFRFDITEAVKRQFRFKEIVKFIKNNAVPLIGAGAGMA